MATITKQRPQILKGVEKLTLTYIKQLVLVENIESEELVCQKVKDIYNDLLKSNPSTSDEKLEFKAEDGSRNLKEAVFIASTDMERLQVRIKYWAIEKKTSFIG